MALKSLKYSSVMLISLSISWAAIAGEVKTDNQVNGTGHVSLYYNRLDKDYGGTTGGKILIDLTGLTPSNTYKLWYSNAAANSTWSVLSDFTYSISTGTQSASGGLFTPDQSTSTITIKHSQLPLDGDPDGDYFRFGLHPDDINKAPNDADLNGIQFTIFGAGGSDYDLRYDITPPTSSSLTVRYLMSTATTVLSGDGFETNGDIPAAPNGIKVGSSFPFTSYSKTDDDNITITAPTGDFEGSVLVLDAAGNWSTTGPTITVDNTDPSVTGIGTVSIKQGGTSLISGTGFSTSGGASPIKTVSLGGTTSPHTFTVDEDNNQITVTAITGSYGGNVVVTDEAGNSSAVNASMKIFVDNSAPVITSISSTLRRDGQTFTLDGTGFQENSIDVTMTIGGSVPTGLTYVVGSDILITVTCGSGEVYDGTILLTDDAGNTSNTSYSVTIDNTKPTVNSVSEQYIRGGVTTVISGDEFKDNQNNATTVKLTGSVTRTYSVGTGPGTFTVNNDESITLNGHNSEDVTGGIITVVDAAGNESDAGSVTITVDNVDPTVTGFGTSPALIKNGTQIIIQGTGFNTGSPVASVSIGGTGSATGGFSYTIVDDGQIRLTAGGTSVTAGNVVVTDESGNASAEVDKLLEIDNTPPVFSDITPVTSGITALKNTAQAVITGSGFRNSSFSENTDAEVYIGSTASGSWGTGSAMSVNTAGTQITITAGSVDRSGILKIVDKAGNETSVSSNTIYFDNTPPTVTSVSPKVIKNGSEAVITGSGFQTGGDAQTFTINAVEPTGATFTVNDDGTITFTAGSEEVNGQIRVTDAAGNVSTNDVKLTIDSTPPTVLSVSPVSIKSGSSATVSGSGFQSIVDGVANNDDATATIGGTSPAGMSITVVDDETITLTAGSGEITEGNVLISDRAGNQSVNTGILLTIDNTEPLISSVSVGSIKSGGTSKITGTGFTIGGNPSSVSIGGQSGSSNFTYSVDSNSQITVTAATSVNITDGQIVVTDAAGNASSSAVFLQIDNTKPTVTSVSSSAIRSGQTTTITGTGFTVGSYNVEAKTVKVGGSVPTGLTFSVDSPTQITVTAGSGEVTDGNVTVTDSAGNESTNTDKLLTIDNTAPTVTGISTDNWLRSGETAVITGTGFTDNGNASAVSIGGKDLVTAVVSGGLGGSFTVDNNTQITITAGEGEVTRGTVLVTDFVGNTSAATTAVASIDNTAPGAPMITLWTQDSGFFNNDLISYDTTPYFYISDGNKGDSVIIKLGTTPLLGDRLTSSGTQYLRWDPDATDANCAANTYYCNDMVAGAPESITGGSGTYAFNATLIDSAGNESSSSTLTYTLDITNPSTPVIDGIATASNSGESSTDKITNDNTPTFQISNVTVGNVLLVYHRYGWPENWTLQDVDKDTIDTVPYLVTLMTALDDSSEHDLYVTHYDTAGNGVGSAGFYDYTIDTESPTCILSYSDSLVRFEDDQVTITATFTDGMNSTDVPTISVDFPETGNDISNANMTATANNDSVWTYILSLVDGIDGTATVTTDGTDNAGNALLTGSTTGTQLLRIDNTDPTFTSVSPDTSDFINHRKLGWVLSEDLFSGTVGFTQVDGPGTDVTVSLTGTELVGGTRTAAELTNGPALVDGTKYDMVITGVDSAGNTGTITIPDVTFDTTGVIVDSLVYSKDPVMPGDTVTISAYFNEIVPNSPTLAIDWPELTTETISLDSTVGGAMLQWLGPAVVPNTSRTGIAKVTPSAQDRASNAIASITGRTVLYDSTLIVDSTAPSCSLFYANTTQPGLQNLGKGGDEILITAKFDEKVKGITLTPTLTIQFVDTSDHTYEDTPFTGSANDDSTWTFTITSLPSDSGYTGAMTLSLTALDLADNPIATVTGTSDFQIDNIPPAVFSTGAVVPKGALPKAGWFNQRTDSLSITAPMDSEDESLSLGKFQVRMQIDGVPSSLTDVGSPITLTNISGPKTIYLQKDTVRSVVSLTDFQQGAKLLTWVQLFDQVGNSTLGTISTDTLVIDTIPPVKAQYVGGNVVNGDTLISSDSISVVWASFDEDTLTGESGIDLYQIALGKFGSTRLDSVMTWTSVGTDTFASVKDTLTHLMRYDVSIREIDNAGNRSDTLQTTLGFLRLNSAPVFDTITAQVAKEDVLFTYQANATDKDTTTILDDTLHYTILDTGITGATNKMTIDEFTGLLTWNTPLQPDAGNFNVVLKVTDEWLIPGGSSNYADTTNFILSVRAVNDTPVVSQIPNVQFMEDATFGDTLNLTQYVDDVDDNDSTDITWSVEIKPDNNTYPSYPILIFEPGTPSRIREAVQNLVYRKEKRSRGPRNRYLFDGRADPTLTVVWDTTGALTKIIFKADSNYYVQNRQVIFWATDDSLASDSTSISVTITPINDPPDITAMNDTTMWENDTLILTLRAIDIDDSTVTFQVKPDSSKMAYTVTDSQVTFIPEKLWSRESKILVIVSDEEFSDSTTFALDILRVTRPHLSMSFAENATYSRFFQIMVTDTAEKTVDLTVSLRPQGIEIPMKLVTSYTWVTSHEFDTTGTFYFDMYGVAKVGDTTITRSTELALARANRSWRASSPDGIFHVEGKAGSVSFDKPFMIVDSLLFRSKQIDGGLYRMGHPMLSFEKPVMVSLPAHSSLPEDKQAIYQRSRDGMWREIPTISKDENLMSWTSDMGFFKLGKRTIIVPEKTALGTNYPNPFNAETHIVFDIGFFGGPDQRVDVSVFNILGQHVKTLHHGPMSIGRHDLVWRSIDESGAYVSSGVYILRLITDSGAIQSKKMMLLR